MPSPSSLWIAVVQILLSVNSMLDGCEITETKEIGACEVLRAQELTHTVSPQAGSNIQKREDNREGKKSGMH